MSDLMLLDDYAEAVKNRDWYTCDLISDRVKPLLNKINQLQAENKLLRECVEFYSDENNWFDTHKSYKKDFRKIRKDDGTDVLNVGGKLARETLAKIKGDV